jgi:hypothetical protein
MKKIIASAVGIVMIGGVAVTNASAVENIFGGYWRVRGIYQSDFDGSDSSYNRFDSRTRLYYTAKFSDDFKFVNKFEHDVNWGDDVGGDIGADGKIFEIKNAYADFNLGSVNNVWGMQGYAISRGFMFDSDFSGIRITPKVGDTLIPLTWARVHGEYVSETGVDEDFVALEGKIGLGDTGRVTPYVVWHGSNGELGDLNAWYLGVDADIKFGDASTWGTFIYQGGTNVLDEDNKGYLFAIGGNMSIAHGQFFYASGDDNALDGDNEQFLGVPGRSYYWSEIMGYGTFDNQVSNGSPGDAISNIYAFNLGVKAKVSDVWTLSGDWWYAALAENNEFGEDKLGNEFDLKATYKVMDNLNLDLIAAYLVAGDATGDEDPVEVGARLSLSF